MVIAVDVDYVVVSFLDKLLEFLNENSNGKQQNITERDIILQSYNGVTNTVVPSISYNPSEHFEMKEGVDIEDFFKLSDLYDDLNPIAFSTKILKKLSDEGNTIVFVSHCYAGHLDSKKAFLKKFFPFHDGFIATEDKHFVDCDVMIDDRIKNHERSKAKKKIVFSSVCKQEQKYQELYKSLMLSHNKKVGNYFLVNDWLEIYKLIGKC